MSDTFNSYEEACEEARKRGYEETDQGIFTHPDGRQMLAMKSLSGSQGFLIDAGQKPQKIKGNFFVDIKTEYL
jgi:hypothetical protein